jgi:hypothetical protein
LASFARFYFDLCCAKRVLRTLAPRRYGFPSATKFAAKHARNRVYSAAGTGFLLDFAIFGRVGAADIASAAKKLRGV